MRRENRHPSTDVFHYVNVRPGLNIWAFDNLNYRFVLCQYIIYFFNISEYYLVNMHIVFIALLWVCVG